MTKEILDPERIPSNEKILHLLALFDPVHSLSKWQEKYPGISHLYIIAALKDICVYIQKSAFLPTKKECTELLDRKLQPYLFQKKKVVKHLKGHKHRASMTVRYPEISPDTIQATLNEGARQIAEADDVYLSQWTGLTFISHTLSNLRFLFHKEHPKIEEKTPEIPDERSEWRIFLSTFARELYKSTAFTSAPLGCMLCNSYFILVTEVNPRSIPSFVNPMTVTTGLVASVPVAWAITRAKHTAQERVQRNKRLREIQQHHTTINDE